MLVAMRKLRYLGREMKAGDVFDPSPDPDLTKKLIAGRFAELVEQPADERPPGSGRSTRRAKTAAA